MPLLPPPPHLLPLTSFPHTPLLLLSLTLTQARSAHSTQEEAQPRGAAKRSSQERQPGAVARSGSQEWQPGGMGKASGWPRPRGPCPPQPGGTARREEQQATRRQQGVSNGTWR
ncbi:hypothetical protein V8C86DRAFT_2473656 [Haematococcus lacustris]